MPSFSERPTEGWNQQNDNVSRYWSFFKTEQMDKLKKKKKKKEKSPLTLLWQTVWRKCLLPSASQWLSPVVEAPRSLKEGRKWNGLRTNTGRLVTRQVRTVAPMFLRLPRHLSLAKLVPRVLGNTGAQSIQHQRGWSTASGCTHSTVSGEKSIKTKSPNCAETCSSWLHNLFNCPSPQLLQSLLQEGVTSRSPVCWPARNHVAKTWIWRGLDGATPTWRVTRWWRTTHSGADCFLQLCRWMSWPARCFEREAWWRPRGGAALAVRIGTVRTKPWREGLRPGRRTWPLESKGRVHAKLVLPKRPKSSQMWRVCAVWCVTRPLNFKIENDY